MAIQTTLALGRIKMMNRGTWSSSASYAKSDLVQYNGVTYVYKNDVSKSYTALFFGPQSSFPFNGTISTLAANTNTFQITWATALPSTADSRIVPNSTIFVYNKYFESSPLITSVTHNSTTLSTITVNRQSTNVSAVSNVPTVVGPRRVSNKYEVSLNTTDWDLLGESMVFAGDWNPTTAYVPGQIVVKNNQSYICVTGITGVDPLWDYLGAWEPFLVGNEALPHERFLTAPNANPWGWRGHPFVPNPTWNGNTYTGIPWNLPAAQKDSYFAGLWNSNRNQGFMDYRGASTDFADAQGNQLAKGYGYYNWGTGGSGDTRMHVGECGPMFNNDYFTDVAPNYGNVPYRKSKSNPRVVQSGHAWANRAVLLSNGTMLMQGDNGDGKCGIGEDTNPSLPWVQLGRGDFGNRSVVKFSQGAWGGRDGTSHTMALDEYGEIWCWGSNNWSQCGTGPENHLATGYRIAQDNIVRSPFCLTKEVHFEGNRIVDIVACSYSSYALDETGQLWAWGRNNAGQLGFPTNTGFASADRSRAPYKIPVNWATYGGIQKFIASGCEGDDWLTVLDGQGHVWNCGYNGSGQLGLNNTTNDSNATAIRRTSATLGWSIGGGIKNIFVVHSGSPQTYFVDASNQLWATGYGSHYRFGTDGNRITPVQLYGPNGPLTNIVMVECSGRAGGTTVQLLDIDGVSYASGWNGYGDGGVGYDTYPSAAYGYARNQQFNASSTAAFQRALMPPSWQKDVVYMWSYGDYDGTSSHINNRWWVNSRGELLQAGRDYNYTNPYSWGQARSPSTVPNFF